MELRQLEIFCQVVRRRGFSAAAEALSLTQPTVSFQIAALEEELGTRLLDRSGRQTTMTRSGEVLHRYALQMLELSDEARQAIHQLEGLMWGEVRIGTSTIPGEYILPKLLQLFRESHPGIVVEMVIGDSTSTLNKIISNEVEIGVVGLSVDDPKLNFIRFVEDRLVMVASPGNSWFAGNRTETTGLPKVPFIAREKGSGTRAIMEKKLTALGFDPSKLNTVMIMSGTEAVKNAVLAGAGVAIISERAVRGEIERGQMMAIDIIGFEAGRDFFLVHRRKKVLSPAGEALLQFLASGTAIER